MNRLFLRRTVVTLLATLSCLTAQRLMAAGREIRMNAADLTVIAESTWTGCTSGGYYPIRFRISNRGPDCEVTARFAGSDSGISQNMPTTTKSVTISQNETVFFTLLIPMVSRGTSGRLYVEKNNRRNNKLSTSLSFDYAIGDMYNRDVPALLIIEDGGLDLSAYNNVIQSLFLGTYAGAVPASSVSGAVPANTQQISSELLPDTWLAYSGLDLVALSLKTLEAMATENRAALIQWVETGGNMIIYEVGADAPEPELMTRLLQLKQRKSLGQNWDDRDIYAIRNLQQGQLISIPINPFPATSQSGSFTASDWQELLSTGPRSTSVLTKQDLFWGVRHGVRPRAGHAEFYRFLIPGIRGVPAVSFITLITIFSLMIGPVNYFFFWKQKQLGLLVITIPLIACTTSLCLFGYSAIAHGFGIKSRLRSLTVVDQGSNTAVTTTRMAIFAGATPSRGLQFSPQTAVYPLWPGSNTFETGHTDWTDKQILTAGWLRSRTRTQFVTVSHQPQRGRLDIKKTDDNTIRVDNGFETDLDCLVVTDNEGKHYYTSRVPAGARAELIPLNATAKQTILKRVGDYPMTLPKAMEDGSPNIFGKRVRRRYRAGLADNSRAFPVGYDNSTAEEAVKSYVNHLKVDRSSQNSDHRNTYFALFRENPGIDTGYRYAAEKASRHCLIGYY